MGLGLCLRVMSGTNRVLVFDTFSYNGEPIVELRLEYLAPHIDCFVLIEARQSHSGVRKNELYVDKNANMFTPYVEAGKLVIMVIDEFPAMPSDWPARCGDDSYMNGESYESWFREQYQRDIAAEYLAKRFGQKEYLVICSDVDEIVNADVVGSLRSQYFALCDPAYFEMKFYYYNFVWQKKHPWYKAFVINDMGLRRGTLSSYRNRKYASQIVPNGGWHASYFMDADGLRRKLTSFAHRECDLDERKTDSHMRACFMEGKDIAGRGENDDCVRVDVMGLPPLFQTFHEKLVTVQTIE